MSGVTDADGTTTTAYRWQELLNTTWTDLTGTAVATLDIPKDQSYVGKTVRVVATTTDVLGGTTEFISSGATVANVNDAPTGSVTIAGSAALGQTLTASNTLDDPDGLGTVTYTWRAGDSTLATGATYILTEGDVGKTITVTASYTDGGNAAESVTSEATAAVAHVNRSPTGNVTIAGTPTQGQTLTASNSLADADGLGAITYTWQANGATIGIGSTYALTQTEVGKTITVTASYTDGSNNAESVTSPATAAVANVDDEATGTLSVTGNSIVGSLLTATITELVDADGLVTSIGWQWQRGTTPESGGALVWADIPGATDGDFSIPVGSDQLGAALRVVVTTGDAAGGTTALISPPTAEVEGVQATIAARFWADAAPLAAVLIETDTDAMQAQTGPNGNGTLDGVSGTSLRLSAQKTIATQDTSVASQAVTLQDAVSILKMIAGQQVNADGSLIPRAQSLAADFDGSGAVSLADAIGVLRHAVGLQAPAPSWVFIEDGDDSNPSVLSPGIPGPVDVVVAPPVPVDVNLVGILRGDVDGSYGVYPV